MVDQHTQVMRGLTAIAETPDEEVLVIEHVGRHPGSLESAVPTVSNQSGRRTPAGSELSDGAGAVQLDDHGVHGIERGKQSQGIRTRISGKEVDHGGAKDQHRVGIVQFGTHPLCEQRAGQRFGNRGFRLVSETAGGSKRGGADVIQ